MNLTDRWSKGWLLSVPHPYRLIATPEPNCNLSCEHCYFGHAKIAHFPFKWDRGISFALANDIDVLCAGRVASPRVDNFISQYIAAAEAHQKKTKLSVVDNGYTVFNLEHHFDHINTFNISIDGSDHAHDRQRRKVGSARVAWTAIEKLQARGFDPILSSCLSPITMKNWDEFEKEAEQTDVRLSVSLTLQIGSARSPSLFSNPDQRAKALELLVTGIPKLVQIYDTRDIEPLHKVLGDSAIWQKDEEIPGMTTLPNGVVVVYRPHSLLCLVEYLMDHEGKVFTHKNSEKSLPELNKKELLAWNIWKHSGI